MSPDEQARRAGDLLADLYRDVHARAMADVPICNDRLAVEALGFRAWGALALGVVVTPWFMNIVLAPRGDAPLPAAPAGATTSVALPAGRVDFVAGALEGFGPIWTCSLFSPMHEFADQAGARATAKAAISALTEPPAMNPPPMALATPDRLDRRALMRGHFVDRGTTT
jgi:[NiFe] hydrogenase assembly HybE family chaperone